MYAPNDQPPQSSHEFVVTILREDWVEGSGVLISDRHVLTAAHLKDPDEIFIGSDISAEGVRLEIADRINFYDYVSANHYGDLSIVTLAEPCLVQPALFFGQMVEKGQQVCLVGYGATDTFGREGYGVRRQTPTEGELTVISVNCDEDAIKDDFQCVEGNFIAQNSDGWDSCKGDSGGAGLVLHNGIWMLAGIISAGPDDRCGFGTVLVRLDLPERQRWIQEVIQS